MSKYANVIWSPNKDLDLDSHIQPNLSYDTATHGHLLPHRTSMYIKTNVKGKFSARMVVQNKLRCPCPRELVKAALSRAELRSGIGSSQRAPRLMRWPRAGWYIALIQSWIIDVLGEARLPLCRRAWRNYGEIAGIRTSWRKYLHVVNGRETLFHKLEIPSWYSSKCNAMQTKRSSTAPP